MLQAVSGSIGAPAMAHQHMGIAVEAHGIDQEILLDRSKVTGKILNGPNRQAGRTKQLKIVEPPALH